MPGVAILFSHVCVHTYVVVCLCVCVCVCVRDRLALYRASNKEDLVKVLQRKHIIYS